MTCVDLNCDLGEGMGDDAVVMPHLTSASIACGLHAGDPSTMRRTAQLARDRGVAIGAHPSYPDREGFGRREMPMSPEDVYALVLYQIGALGALAAGQRLQHVKPHGALYHAAATRPEIADAVAAAAHAARPDVILIGPPSSALTRASRRLGLRFAAEGFADRAYGDDGRLLPRSDPRALLTGDDATIAARAVEMILRQQVTTVSGARLPLAVHTLCLHGDEPGVATRAAAIRTALHAARVHVAPLSSWL